MSCVGPPSISTSSCGPWLRTSWIPACDPRSAPTRDTETGTTSKSTAQPIVRESRCWSTVRTSRCPLGVLVVRTDDDQCLRGCEVSNQSLRVPRLPRLFRALAGVVLVELDEQPGELAAHRR